MNALDLLIDSLGRGAVFDTGRWLATFLAAAVAPALLAVAIFVRILQGALDAVGGRPTWNAAVRAFLGWAFVLSIYFGAVNLVLEFFRALYAVFFELGSLKAVLAQFAETAAAMRENVDFDFSLRDLGGGAAYGVAWLCYYGSLLILLCVALFLGLAHAVTLSLTLAWGLVAIPMAIPRGFDLLKPWARLLAVLLVWPMVSSVIFVFIDGALAHAFEQVGNGPQAAVTRYEDVAALYLVYAVGHILLAAATVAAPFVAQALISSGSVGGLVGSFTAGAVGSAMMLSRAERGAAVQAAGMAGGAAAQLSGQTGRAYGGLDAALGRQVQRGLNAVTGGFGPPSPPEGGGPSGGPGPGAARSAAPMQAQQGASPGTPAGQAPDTAVSVAGAPAAGVASPSAPAAQPPGSGTDAPVGPVVGTATAQAVAGDSAQDGAGSPAGDPAEPMGEDEAARQRARAQARRGAVLDRLHKTGQVSIPGRKP